MSSTNEHEQTLGEAVTRLVGLECWGAAAGEGTAARFSLQLGQKFLLDRPIPNELLTQVVRENEAEFSLFVQDRPWRVQTADAVVASWVDDNANDGPMVAALDRLVGARVVQAELFPPALDLRLTFDNGLSLVVFADSSPRLDDYYDDDYIVFTRHRSIAVGRGGQVKSEKRLLDVDLREEP